jgi:hypothetical protein
MNQKRGWYVLAWFTVACSGTRGSQPAASSPIPATLPVTVPTVESWSFNYAPGTSTYRISRNAAIERGSPDSGTKREISTNTTRELLTFELSDQGTKFTALVDSSITTTQGLIGPVQPAVLPVEISGILLDNNLTIQDDVSGQKCNPVSSMMVVDLHSLIVAFPAQLSSGAAWRDSTDIRGCQAGVPTVSHTTRSYVVSGQSLHDGRPVLLIVRTDTTRAHGEGGLQQHRVSIDATGTGTAVYYLDPTAGKIVRLTIDQTLNVTGVASARQFQFKQDSKQDFRSVP